MDFDAQHLFWGVITSAVGTGYFVYGKKQSRFVPLVAGIALWVAPWCFDAMWASYLVGGLLLAVPFVVRA